MTTIIRHEDKTRTRKWPTPTHNTLRKEHWCVKGFPGKPPDKGRISHRGFGQGAKTNMFDPHRYPRRYKEGIQSRGEKKHQFEGKEGPPSNKINWLIKMGKKRQGQMIWYTGQRLLEDNQFQARRIVMSSSALALRTNLLTYVIPVGSSGY